jgi:hypothetical protein
LKLLYQITSLIKLTPKQIKFVIQPEVQVTGTGEMRTIPVLTFKIVRALVLVQEPAAPWLAVQVQLAPLLLLHA